MKLYTKTICPKCLWVKDTIKRKGLDVEILNTDHNEEAKQVLIDNGIMAVPVLEVDGELIVDVAKQMELLEDL